MTYRQLSDQTVAALMQRYAEGEARWMTRIAMEEITGLSRVDLLLKANDEVSDFRAGQIKTVAERLLKGEPLQYILGYETFMGLRLKVTPDVLIPRPETEQLVQLILDRVGQTPDLRVLDIATGSGCIALALARQLPFAQVDALDISDAALAVARENAKTLKIPVNFFRGDILSLPEGLGLYDLIVCNPPYVLDSERDEVPQNVLLHEPHTALFVPDSDSLRFYLPVADFAARHLAPGGTLWFELNPLTAKPLAEQMRKMAAFSDITLTPDIHGKTRYLTASARADA